MMEQKEAADHPSPSKFMRQLRPELYSDSTSRAQYRLSAEVLSHHLDTLTDRNETHDFELFCRKLCERTICPNLRPATGPEGGGDSKADTETTPVAEEIGKLTYIGTANSGSERWAFAFSAKKTWSKKAKSDVAGIIATARGYRRIYFVTSRAARAKDRARVEDELTKKYGIPLVIHDRSWIIDEVVHKDRRELAFHYLKIGEESRDRDLGPSDYSRSRQLAEIERELEDPSAFEGKHLHRATEALVAAKLARGLELPRTDVEGRFMRAIRLADDGGTFGQQLAARYELLWTAFWWFDDLKAVLSGYDGLESLVIADSQSKNLEPLCNLAQLLFNAVINGQLTAEQVQLEPRIARLSAKLMQLSDDPDRPNNALEALVSFLVIQVNQALLTRDQRALEALWPKFSDALARAEGLGEFDASRMTQLIERFGQIAGSDGGYRDLVDELSNFTIKRTGEGEGALVLLRRAEQLPLDRNMELIRLLGRAAYLLSKKEHAQQRVSALAQLAVAYKSAGLGWAARASATSAAATMFVDASSDSGAGPPAIAFPILMNVAWMALSLKYMPDVLEAIQVARGCLNALPYDDESAESARKQLESFDMVLACEMLRFTERELLELRSLPDVLRGLELDHSCSALMFRLGYEDQLRTEGWIPESESRDDVANLYAQMAEHPTGVSRWRPPVFNAGETHVRATVVLGVRITITHTTTDTCVIVAEAIAGAIEAFFATAFELDAYGHVEQFDISVVDDSVATFVIEKEIDHMRLVVRAPEGAFPGSSTIYPDFQRALLEIAATTFWTTCRTRSPDAALTRLLDSDSAAHRLAMIGSLCISRSRIFGGVARLSNWDKYSARMYEFRTGRPTVVPPAKQHSSVMAETEDKEEFSGSLKDHLDVQVRSVIDVHLWDRAEWSGVAFGSFGPTVPPFLALLFKDEAAAIKIFERWRTRFGEADEADEIYVGIIRHYSDEHPAHYGVVLTSRPTDIGLRVGFSTVVSRSQSMEPVNEVNLSWFIKEYRRVGAYMLMPMVLAPGQAEPRLLKQLHLLKRALSVKRASEVCHDDPELMFLKPRGLGPPET